MSILSGAECRQLAEDWAAIGSGSRGDALQNQAETPDSFRILTDWEEQCLERSVPSSQPLLPSTADTEASGRRVAGWVGGSDGLQ